MKKIAVISLVFGFFFIATISMSWAGSDEEENIVQPHLYKFSRGIVNIGSSPLEVPKQMIKRAQDGKTWGGQLAGYLTGTVTGIGWGVWRLGSGVIDVFSAPFSGNEKGKITPEFVTDENPLEE